MNPQLMAMLNGMYGGIPSDTDGIMPLGSGFAGQALPQQAPQVPSFGSGMYGGGIPSNTDGIMPLGSGYAGQQLPQQTPQQPDASAQGGLPNMPLGSGMYGMNVQDPQGQFELGSGLYGQSVPGQQGSQPQAQQAQPQADSSGMDKFSQLMNNPMFQYGMGLVGAMHTTNPWGGGMQAFLQAQGQQAKIKQANAAAAAEAQRVRIAQQQADYAAKHGDATLAQGDTRLTQEQQQIDQARQQWEAGAPMRAAQLQYMGQQGAHLGIEDQVSQAQIPNIAKQGNLYDAQANRLGTESQLDQQKVDMAKRQLAMQDPVLRLMMSQLGLAPPPDASVNGSGMQQQSMPAPAAQGPAKGGGEWTKRTADYRANQPTADTERAAIIQQELAQEKDPGNRAALERELTRIGAPAQQVMDPQQMPAPQTQGGTSVDPLVLGKVGALAGMVGMPGGAGLIDYAKMAQPQQVPAGGYTRDPQTGTMAFNRDPYKEVSSANETAKTNAELIKQGTERAQTQANDTKSMSTITGSMQRLANTAGELAKHPGLENNTGWKGALGFNKVPNSQGKDASVMLDSLKSKMVIEAMTTLKEASKTGSTGFGQLSEQENQRLENYVANLDRAQTKESMQKALTDIQQFASGSLKAHQERYNSLYGEGRPAVSANGPAPDANAPARTEPVMSVSDFLKAQREKKKK